MAGLRGILAGLAIGSAIISLPAVAQPGASASLTHTVTVTVPSRVNVQLAQFAVSTPAPVRLSSRQANTDGLSLTIRATQAWVLAIGRVYGVAARKSHLQWSPDGNSGFSTVTSRDVAVASGAGSYGAKATTLFFARGGDGEPIVLTVSAP